MFMYFSVLECNSTRLLLSTVEAVKAYQIEVEIEND